MLRRVHIVSHGDSQISSVTVTTFVPVWLPLRLNRFSCARILTLPIGECLQAGTMAGFQVLVLLLVGQLTVGLATSVTFNLVANGYNENWLAGHATWYGDPQGEGSSGKLPILIYPPLNSHHESCNLICPRLAMSTDVALIQSISSQSISSL